MTSNSEPSSAVLVPSINPFGTPPISSTPPNPPPPLLIASYKSVYPLLLKVLLVAALLPTISLAIAANVLVFTLGQRQAVDRLNTAVSERQTALEHWLDDLNVSLYVITRTDAAVQALTQELPLSDDMLHDARADFAKLLRPDTLNEITLVSWDNRILTSTSPNRLSLPPRLCGPRAICLFGPFRENGRVWIGVQYPIIDAQSQTNGEVIGLADASMFDRVLGNRAGLGSTGNAYLVNADGGLYWLPGHGPLDTRVAIPDLTHNVTPSEPLTYSGAYDSNVLGTSVFIPLLNTWLIVEQSTSEIMQPSASLLLLTISMLALLIAAVLVASRLTGRRIDQRLRSTAERVTQLDAALDTLRQADQQKNLAVANMSHELRTPINATLNFSGFLLDGLFGTLTPDQTELVRQMHGSSQHLLDLINDLLDISKIEAGQMRLFVTDYDPAPVFDQAIATLNGLTREKPIRVEVDLPRTWPTVRGDKRRMLQILLNLVSNAAKFTEQGAITLRVHVYATRLEIRIEDSGSGVDPADVPHLFEPYRQGYNALLLEKGGTGLGLPLSRIFARMHGGDLDYLSSETGGAVFICWIPLDVIDYEQKKPDRRDEKLLNI